MGLKLNLFFFFFKEIIYFHSIIKDSEYKVLTVIEKHSQSYDKYNIVDTLKI
jgi:hypothetical protein